jgi:hypothetical protein
MPISNSKYRHKQTIEQWGTALIKLRSALVTHSLCEVEDQLPDESTAEMSAVIEHVSALYERIRRQ